jgi:hypothetical protein
MYCHKLRTIELLYLKLLGSTLLTTLFPSSRDQWNRCHTSPEAAGSVFLTTGWSFDEVSRATSISSFVA